MSISTPSRTSIFPPHSGPNVLPNSPFFTKLLRHAARKRIVVRDHALGVEKTYADLLADALALRSLLEAKLSEDVRRGLRKGGDSFLGVLAPGGYEFAVAMVAALALGAAVVPMSVANPAEEVLYFVQKSRQIALLHSASAAGLARSVATLSIKQGHTLPTLDVTDAIDALPRFSPNEIHISSSCYLDDNAAGVVIFTSGTTGKPKGSVLRRAYIHEAALNVVDGYDITHNDVLLHTLPVHHATGLGTSFFPFLNSGACIEFRTHGGFDAGWVWNRLAQGGITIFSGVPTMYLRLMWHYQSHLAQLPSSQLQPYNKGIQRLRCLLCGSSALQQPVQDFFTSVRNDGRPGILVRYGSSEIPGCIRVSLSSDFSTLPPNSVGTPTTGVAVKFSDEGELLLKSPLMFSGYLHDRDATIAAHDEDGWFKTGDVARQEGDYIFIVGRASVDIIKSGGYKISAPEIEQACLKLDYIREVAVVGVENEEFGQRVGAVVVLKNKEALRLEELRSDLRDKLVGYKMPTLLRVVNGELEKGPTGKIVKTKLRDKMFPVLGWREDEEVMVWESRDKGEKAKL